MADILGPHGWAVCGQQNGVLHVRRPGKEDGESGTIGFCKTEQSGQPKFYCFSGSAAPFEGHKSYAKFTAFALLNHAGDIKTAAKALRALGYGASNQCGPNQSANGTGEHHATTDQCAASEAPPMESPDDDHHSETWEGPEAPPETVAPTVPPLKPIEAHDDPFRLARGFIKERCQHHDALTMRFWREEWHYWDGNFWRRIPPKEPHRHSWTASAKDALDRLNIDSQKLTPSGKAPPTAKKVTARLIADAANALASLTIIPGRIDPSLPG